MRHRKRNGKLGRSSSHRRATISALVCALIIEKRIKTTLAKAKQARRASERMVTLALKGTLAARKLAISRLRRKESVSVLFDEIAPQFVDRPGGYTRILKIGQRSSDGSEMALLEWVDMARPDKKKKTKPETASDTA